MIKHLHVHSEFYYFCDLIVRFVCISLNEMFPSGGDWVNQALT